MMARQIDSFNFAETVRTATEAVLKLSSADTKNVDWRTVPLIVEMMKKLIDGTKITFILPAFPAKSPSPMKTSGILPDLGEVIALRELNEMCHQISSVHPAGAEVIICSDGRVFSDVVMVDDETIDQYAKGIDAIIHEFGLRHISTFSMDDQFPELSAPELRERLLWQFGKSVEEVKHLVRTNGDYTALFNGLHKFMMEDQLGLSSKSKTQLSKEMKEKSYELIRRSDAWSNLLNHYMRDTLRLSIHPYPLTHEKFGVKLVPSSSKWATPWHNVTVKKNGQYELMHLQEAKLMGAEEKIFGGKYVYFEL